MKKNLRFSLEVTLTLSGWAASGAKINCPKRTWTSLNHTHDMTKPQSKSGTKALR